MIYSLPLKHQPSNWLSSNLIKTKQNKRNLKHKVQNQNKYKHRVCKIKTKTKTNIEGVVGVLI